MMFSFCSFLRWHLAWRNCKVCQEVQQMTTLKAKSWLQAVSGKKITDTVDDFVEGLRHFDKEGNGRWSDKHTNKIQIHINAEIQIWSLICHFHKKGHRQNVTCVKSERIPKILNHNFKYRISAIELRHLLTGLGEKMSEEEVGFLF